MTRSRSRVRLKVDLPAGRVTVAPYSDEAKREGEAYLQVLRVVLFLGCAGILLAQPPAQTPEYEGPSILTRGAAPSNTSTRETGIRPYFVVQGTFDNGWTSVNIDPQGNVTNIRSYGVEGQVGLYGEHQWRRSLLELDYRGDFRHYATNSAYDNSNHLLRIGLTHALSKRSQLKLLGMAGTFSRSYMNGLSYYDGNTFQSLPSNEIFDNRVNYFITSATYIYQKSARLSFSVGGDGFLVRRQSSALYGVTGGTARGDMAYRISRRTTIGLNYEFNHYDFTKALGGSDVHSLGINYATRISRLWELSVFAGGSRVESLFLNNVTLDPAVAAILGQTTGVEVAHNIRWAPAIEARLARAFHRAALTFQFTRRINPGNGIYLTSQIQSAVASFDYTGVRYWSFNLSGGYNSLRGMIQSIGTYQSTYVGFGTTRHLAKDFYLTGRIDNRRYDLGLVTDFTRTPLRVAIGLGWSPGDRPLSVW